MTHGRKPVRRSPNMGQPLKENLLWLTALLVGLLVVVSGGLALGVPQNVIMLVAAAMAFGSVAKTRSIWRRHRDG